MKKILLVVIALVCAYVSNAQNNVYGKKVVGLDSLVSDTIRARTQAVPYIEGFGTGVAGNNTEIQFNDNGVFGASSALTWDGDTLTVDGIDFTGSTMTFTSGLPIFNSTLGGGFSFRSFGSGILNYNSGQWAWDFENRSIDDVNDGNFTTVNAGNLKLNGDNITNTTGNSNGVILWGGLNPSISNGAYYAAYGNSHSGNAVISTGNTANSEIRLILPTTTSKIIGRSVVSGSTDLFTVEESGTWDFNTNSLTDIGSLTVDNLTLDGNDISSSTGTVDVTGDATFSGDVTANLYQAYRGSDGALFRGSFDGGTTNNFVVQSLSGDLQLRSTGAYDMVFQTNGANDALTLDQSQNATFSGNVTTNTLDVLNGTSILNFGATFGGDGTLTNNTNKTGRIGVPHYNNSAEESIALAFIQTDASKNQVNIGGGSAVVNAATEINFYTAANTTTTTGTNRLTINSSGNATFSGDVTTGGNITLDKTSANNAELFLLNNGVGYDAIYFGDNADNAEAFIRYDAANPKLELRGGNTGGANLTIEDGGNATFSGDIFAESGTSQDANIYFGETSTTRGLLKWDGTANEVSLTGITSGVDNGGLTIEGSSGNATFSGQLKTEGTIVLDREGDASYATLVIISDDAQRKQVQFKNQDNSRRWNVGSTESSDADFFIEAFNNANVSQGNYFEIERSTGNATFSGDLALSAYGGGSKLAAATYALGVDANGNVVETSASGTIGGSIANNQVAVGNGTDAIDGNSSFTYDGVNDLALSAVTNPKISFTDQTDNLKLEIFANNSRARYDVDPSNTVTSSGHEFYVDGNLIYSVTSGGISGSSLSVTADAGFTSDHIEIDGANRLIQSTFSSLRLDGAHVAVETDLNVTGNATPSVDNTYDVGTASQRWDDIYATNGTIQTSDERLKDSIQSMGTMINKIMQLEPRTWVSKYDDYNVGTSGFVAQEVEQVFPELVQTTTDTLNLQDNTVMIENVKAVQMSGQEMTAIIIKSIQEMIMQYEIKVAELEARLDALEN